MNMRSLIALALASLALACSDDATLPGPDRDNGGRDGGRVVEDSGNDALDDAGPEDTSTADGEAGDDDTATLDDVGQDGGADPDTSELGTTDTRTDTRTDAEPDPCDLDRDGHRSLECGGDDCDDTNARVFPGAREQCDRIDNDCNDVVNDGITCTFFAHTSNQLYEIDPFALTAVYVTDAPNLFDFDTDTDGTLWGISPLSLYRFDPDARRWVVAASLSSFSVGPNGFAIDSRGRAYATAGNELYGIDLETGASTRIGPMGGSYYSSGDCVVDKNDLLYMTSKHLSDQDTLVRLDTNTGAATTIGDIGYRNIFGLTAAWGYLFGLSSAGQLIEIDLATGRGTLIHTFSGRAWYGAASSAGR